MQQETRLINEEDYRFKTLIGYSLRKFVLEKLLRIYYSFNCSYLFPKQKISSKS